MVEESAIPTATESYFQTYQGKLVLAKALQNIREMARHAMQNEEEKQAFLTGKQLDAIGKLASAMFQARNLKDVPQHLLARAVIEGATKAAVIGILSVLQPKVEDESG